MGLPCGVGAALHLQQPRLVQSTGVDVHDVAVGGGSAGQGLVVLKDTHPHTHTLFVSMFPGRPVFLQDWALLTLVAFFVYLALSFSKSCQDLMGIFSSSPTTMPGPCVAGPPMKVMIRAPVFGKVHCR